jgi:hypothetical protein
MRKLLLALATSALLGGSIDAADDVTVFGLRHTVITNAVLTTNGPMGPLRVDNANTTGTNTCEGCDTNQSFGISIHLGSANAGVSVSPDGERVDGYAMDAVVYGNSSLIGTSNALAGIVSGTRVGWGLYEVNVDYSPIGATSYLYEVYCHGRLVFQMSNRGPASMISTYHITSDHPRINPWAVVRGPAATRYGCVIDFPTAVLFYFTNGPSAAGNRIAIFPDTNHLDGISRVDVYGRNGLPWFQINQEELGSFDLAHTALGSVTLQADANLLTYSNLTDAEADGVSVRLEQSELYFANITPLPLTNDFALVFGAAGTSSRVAAGTRLGEVRLQGSNGVVALSADFTDMSAPSSELRVYSNGPSRTLVASVSSANQFLGSLAGTNILLLWYGATATQTNEAAAIHLRLRSPATFTTADGMTLAGDEFHISPAGTEETIGALTQFYLLGGGISGPLVIEKESYQLKPQPPLGLEVSRIASNARVTWPCEPCFYLAAKTNFNAVNWRPATAVYPLPLPPIVYTNFQYQFDLQLSTAPAQFFELINYYEYYFRDVYQP